MRTEQESRLLSRVKGLVHSSEKLIETFNGDDGHDRDKLSRCLEAIVWNLAQIKEVLKFGETGEVEKPPSETL